MSALGLPIGEPRRPIMAGMRPLRGAGPADAGCLGINEGDCIIVTSRRGEVTAKAKITGDSPPGVVFMTFHFAESPTNILTNPILDPVAKIPELKVCAVRVEKL